jgi:hypothetical protein
LSDVPSSVELPSELSFVAGPSLGRTDLPDNFLVLDPSVSVALDGDQICCEEGVTVNSCNDPSCFIAAEDAHTNVSLGLIWDDPEDHTLEQFALQVQYYNDNQDTTTDWWPAIALGGTLPPASEYCYEVTALHFATGSQHTVTTGCIPGDRVELLDIAAHVAQQMNRGLRGCTIPPEGYAEDWCQAFSEELDTGLCDERETAPCDSALLEGPSIQVTFAERDASREDKDTSLLSTSAGGTGCRLSSGGSSDRTWLVITFGLTALALRRRSLRATRICDLAKRIPRCQESPHVKRTGRCT